MAIILLWSGYMCARKLFQAMSGFTNNGTVPVNLKVL